MVFLTNREKKDRKELAKSLAVNILIFLLCLACLVLGVVFLFQSKGSRSEREQQKATADRVKSGHLMAALADKDQSRAEELYNALKESDPVAKDLRHLLFVTALARNDRQYAKTLQRELAPETGTGFGQSHYVVALNLSKRTGLTREDFEKMTRHLKIATRFDDVPVDSFRLLGDGCYALREFGQAIDAYRKIEKPSAEVQYKIALALMGTRNRTKATEEMVVAADRFKVLAQKDPSDTKSLILWTKALFFVGRVTEAENILIAALKNNDNAAIRNELIQCYLEQLRSVGNMVRRKEMLSRICSLDPSMKINPFTRQAFFGLANFLVTEKRYDEARAYYQVSASKIEFPASVRNNLAWIELQVPSGDLQHALKLSNEAIQRAKHVLPEFHGTRGQVLARLGRWEEAASDLGKALPEVRQKKQVGLALAVVLTRMGQKPQAEKILALVSEPASSLDELLEKYPN